MLARVYFNFWYFFCVQHARFRRFGRTIINNKCRLDYAAAQVSTSLKIDLFGL
jgi:hypothetical protein